MFNINVNAAHAVVPFLLVSALVPFAHAQSPVAPVQCRLQVHIGGTPAFDESLSATETGEKRIDFVTQEKGAETFGEKTGEQTGEQWVKTAHSFNFQVILFGDNRYQMRFIDLRNQVMSSVPVVVPQSGEESAELKVTGLAPGAMFPRYQLSANCRLQSQVSPGTPE